MHRRWLVLFLVISAVAALIVLVIWTRHRTAAPQRATDSSSGTLASRHAETPQWGRVTKMSDCVVGGSLPDRACTPGDVLPEMTAESLCSSTFRTETIRDSATSPSEKRRVYEMYNIPHPLNNRGHSQACEIDHLVPLELGGTDTMANLWPQCSPGYAGWQGGGFRDKDRFENYLHRQVCSGSLSLAEAQFQIGTDWYQYWVAAGQP
jgi:hypothetical protein